MCYFFLKERNLHGLSIIAEFKFDFKISAFDMNKKPSVLLKTTNRSINTVRKVNYLLQ